MLKKIIAHKDKLILMKLAVLQILISFLTNFLIVKKIGFTNELDIFYLAMAMYLFLSSSVGWSISSVLTPILIENEDKKIEGSLFLNVVIIGIIISFIAYITSFFWIDLIFNNYIQVVELKLIHDIQNIFLLVFLFDIFNIVLISIMQQKNFYIKINFINLLATIISFLFVYSFIDNYLIYAATFSQLIMRLVIFIILIVFLFSTIKNTIRFKKENFLLLWNRMKYILYGSFYFRLGDLIDRFIASYLTSGFLSLVSFIQKLYEAINTVINSSIVAPTITKFSYLIKEKKIKELDQLYKKYILFLFLVNCIILIPLIIFGEKLFLYFFEEKVQNNLLSMLPTILILLFTICFSQTIGKIIQNLLLSLNQEKQIMKYDIYTFTINIIIKICLTYYFSIVGFLFSVLITEILKYGAKSFLAYKTIKAYK